MVTQSCIKKFFGEMAENTEGYIRIAGEFRKKYYRREELLNTDLVDVYPYCLVKEVGMRPTNIGVHGCTFRQRTIPKRNNIKELMMLQIALDFTFQKGNYRVEAEKIWEKFQKEILEAGLIPGPTYVLHHGKISLLYLFEQKVKLGYREKEKLLCPIEEYMLSVCEVINGLDEKYGAKFDLLDKVLLPGQRHVKDIHKRLSHNNWCEEVKILPIRECYKNIEELLSFPVCNPKKDEIRMLQREEFLNILFHEKRASIIAKAYTWKYDRKETYGYEYYENSEDLLKASRQEKEGEYVSIHPVCKKQIGNGCVYNYNAIFVDLDCHGGEGEGCLEERLRQKYINEAVVELTMAFYLQELPIPTMMLRTGRGVALYYVFEKSIPASNQKASRKYKLLWRHMISYFSDFLKLHNLSLDADLSVINDCRLVRLPESINQNNKKECQLVFVNKINENEVCYTSMKKLSDFIELNEIILREKVAKQETVAKDVCLKPKMAPKSVTECRREESEKVKRKSNLVERRIYQLINYLVAIDYKVAEYNQRDMILFLFYNHLVQIHGHDDAMELLYRINSCFDIPLSNREIDGYMGSSYRRYLVNGIGYSMSDEKFQLKLGILEDTEMLSIIGTTKSLQLLQKQEQRQWNALKRAEEDYRMISLLNCRPDLTNAELAHILGIKRETLKKRLQSLGFHRDGCPVYVEPPMYPKLKALDLITPGYHRELEEIVYA